jgi:ketosteroid isomerase-like protein
MPDNGHHKRSSQKVRGRGLEVFGAQPPSLKDLPSQNEESVSGSAGRLGTTLPKETTMRKQSLSLVVVLFVLAGGLFFITKGTSKEADQQAIAAQIIAREKASVEAWKRKDKAFFADFMAEDATYFGPMNPYLETDPKANFLPKFEQYVEQFKYLDNQMYNPRVQVYGDTAVLTYNSSVSATFGGQPLNYTAKMTSVYVKQGNTWRVVHGHESMNPTVK